MGLQAWVWGLKDRGLRTQPCGVPELRLGDMEMQELSLTLWLDWECPKFVSLDTSLSGRMGLKANIYKKNLHTARLLLYVGQRGDLRQKTWAKCNGELRMGVKIPVKSPSGPATFLESINCNMHLTLCSSTLRIQMWTTRCSMTSSVDFCSLSQYCLTCLEDSPLGARAARHVHWDVLWDNSVVRRRSM